MEINKILKDPVKYANDIDINILEKILRFLADKYHNTEETIVSDIVYDQLKEVLEERDPKNKFLKEVGAEIDTLKKKYKLPFFMGSLDKIKADEKILGKWKNKHTGPYVISDKLDGASAQLFKQDDGTFRLFTRGNGEEGHDISHLISYVVNKKFKFDEVDNLTSIRGELIISKTKFQEIAHRMKNSRAAVIGLINSKTFDDDSKEIANMTKFVAYNILNPVMIHSAQLLKLKKWNMDIVEYKIKDNVSFETLLEYLKERKINSPYEIDGIVVADDSKLHEIPNGNPEYAFAFKALLDDQIAETTIIKIIWTPSMDGYLIPTINIKPVELLGTTIKSATAFNAKFIVDNKLGKGAIIKIIKGGDIIPDIHEIVKPAKQADMPDVEYEWGESGVNIIMKNFATSPLVIIKRITHFFRKIGVKFLSEGIITKLVNNGYNSIVKILNADKKNLVELDGIGTKLVNKIYNSIEQAIKNMDLANFMAASHVFGRGLGETKLKLIIDAIPDIMIKNYKRDDLVKKINCIEGFADISTEKFIDNLDNFKEFFNEINDIYDLSDLIKYKKEIPTGNLFEGKGNIVFSGERSPEAEKFIVNNGGKVSNSVSKKNTFMVVYSGDASTSKVQSAKDNGIPIILLDEFKKKFMEKK